MPALIATLAQIGALILAWATRRTLKKQLD